MGTTDCMRLPGTPVQGAPAAGEGFFSSSSPVLLSAGRASGGSGKAFVTRDMVRMARKADLSGFLLQRHPDLFASSGVSVYMRSRDSLYVRKGFPGFTDFSSGAHGNPIDFLTGYLGYGFVDAVMALTEGAAREAAAAVPQAARGPIALPERADRPFRRVYAYLAGRGIPPETVRLLERRGLLYQEKRHGNAVFVNPERDYCEIRGTLTYASRPFHGCLKSSPDRFWYLLGAGEKPETAYLCEGAIDAVSLFLLHHGAGKKDPAVYVSIGGVSNQKTIERVKCRMHSVLAVDNDRAGDLCRERNPEMESIVPSGKDWNEDLQSLTPDPGHSRPSPRPL